MNCTPKICKRLRKDRRRNSCPVKWCRSIYNRLLNITPYLSCKIKIWELIIIIKSLSIRNKIIKTTCSLMHLSKILTWIQFFIIFSMIWLYMVNNITIINLISIKNLKTMSVGHVQAGTYAMPTTSATWLHVIWLQLTRAEPSPALCCSWSINLYQC